MRAPSFSFIPVLLLAAWSSLPALAGEEKEKEKDEDGIVPIVATVNGALITRFDIDWELGYARQVVRGTPEEKRRQLEELRKVTLKNLIMEQILIQAAKRFGIKVTDRMVQDEIREAAKRQGGMGAYVRLLNEQGLTYAENWRRLKNHIYMREFQRRLVTSRSHTHFVYPFFTEISVTPAEVRDYYDRNPGDFQEEVPGRFRVLRLDFDTLGNRKATIEKVLTLRARILLGADLESRARIFGTLAAEHSKDESAKEGGVMPLTHTPALNPELHKELLKLEPGELSEPIDTDFGIVLLFMETPLAKVPSPFSEVQKEIQERLRNLKWQDHMRDEEERLLKEARIWPSEVEDIIRKSVRR